MDSATVSASFVKQAAGILPWRKLALTKNDYRLADAAQCRQGDGMLFGVACLQGSPVVLS